MVDIWVKASKGGHFIVKYKVKESICNLVHMLCILTSLCLFKLKRKEAYNGKHCLYKPTAIYVL